MFKHENVSSTTEQSNTQSYWRINRVAKELVTISMEVSELVVKSEKVTEIIVHKFLKPLKKIKHQGRVWWVHCKSLNLATGYNKINHITFLKSYSQVNSNNSRHGKFVTILK